MLFANLFILALVIIGLLLVFLEKGEKQVEAVPVRVRSNERRK